MELKCSFISYLVLNLDQWCISEGSVSFVKDCYKVLLLEICHNLVPIMEIAIWAPQKAHQEGDVVLLKYGKNLPEILQNTTGFHKYSIFQLTGLWTTTLSLQQ